MRILITGSRDWTDAETIAQAIMEHAPSQATIVHGNCRGADLIAAEEAYWLGHDIEPHPADWNKHGKRAGFVRNAEMVSLGADVCLAFIKNDSKGSTMCAKLAEGAGIRTVYYRETS